MDTKQGLPILAFASQREWEAWLDAQHATSKGLWLKIAKKDSGLDSVTSCGRSTPSSRGGQIAPSNCPAGASLRRRQSASQASCAQRSSFCTHSSLNPKGGGKSSLRPSGGAGAATSGRRSPKILRTEAATSSGHLPPRTEQRRSLTACLSSASR